MLWILWNSPVEASGPGRGGMRLFVAHGLPRRRGRRMTM
jgi:hypothetical protein